MTEHFSKSKRGFAALAVEHRVAIAKMGGQSIPKEKRAFARDPHLAKRAGSAGGHRRREANAKDAVLMRRALEAPVELKRPLSGRQKRSTDRLLRLGYIREIPISPKAFRFALTEAGRAFLDQLEAQERDDE